MPVIPSGNISLLELIDLAFKQKYGNATVGPLEVDAVHKAVREAIEARDIMLYVESLDGTEKRLTDQQSDESLVWRTLLTGKLEHEPDPAVFQRTVYVRDDDASIFLKEFTGKGLDRPTGDARDTVARTSPLFIKKGVEQPDTATDGTGEGKAAELPESTDPAPPIAAVPGRPKHDKPLKVRRVEWWREIRDGTLKHPHQTKMYFAKDIAKREDVSPEYVYREASRARTGR